MLVKPNFCTIIFALISVSVNPCLVMGQSPQVATGVVVDGIPLIQKSERIVLRSGDVLLGAIVTSNGRPVASTPVVVAQFGKVLHQLTTDSEGRFEAPGIVPGVYQVASFAKAQSYEICRTADEGTAKQGIVHVMNEATVRANSCNDPNCQCHNQACRSRTCQPASRWRCLSNAASHPSLMVGMLLGGAIGVWALIEEAS